MQSILSQHLALNYVNGIGPIWFARLRDSDWSVQDMFEGADFSVLFYQLLGRKERPASPDWARVEKDLKWAVHPSHHILIESDLAYPERLRHIPDPPPVLFVVGRPEVLHLPSLAIVGSRRASVLGKQAAERLAMECASAGLSIVSGLAKGIDAAAHAGALAVAEKTVAVLAHGLHRVYPAEHLALARQILAKDGAIVSEYGLGTEPIPSAFVRRNRVISGLSLGVMVVQASIKSGSLTTARYALDQGREVFAFPGNPTSTLTKGCHVLIKEGATLVESTQDILDDLLIEGGPIT